MLSQLILKRLYKVEFIIPILKIRKARKVTNYQLVQVAQEQGQDIENPFFPHIWKPFCHHALEGQSCYGPNLCILHVNTVFHPLRNICLLPLFSPKVAVSFSVALNAKQPEIAEGREKRPGSKLPFTSQISEQLWMGLVFRKWLLELIVNQIPPNSLPLLVIWRVGNCTNQYNDNLFPSMFPRINCTTGNCRIIYESLKLISKCSLEKKALICFLEWISHSFSNNSKVEPPILGNYY